jgi:hypothetical protein
MNNMGSLKQEALNAISKMPDTVNIDEIMYRLYVIDKVRKGREAVWQGNVISVEELKEEMKSW